MFLQNNRPQLQSCNACGSDGINNEMFKILCTLNINIFVKLFIIIFKYGVFPELWRVNYIKPILKVVTLTIQIITEELQYLAASLNYF